MAGHPWSQHQSAQNNSNRWGSKPHRGRHCNPQTHARGANNGGSTPSLGCSEDGRFPRQRARRSAAAALPPCRTWGSYVLRRPQAHAGAELQACRSWERPLRDKRCCHPASHGTGKGPWGWAGPPHPPAPASRGAGEARGYQLSLLSQKKLKGAPGPQPRAPLLANELLRLFTSLFLFYMDCDLLRARGKVPTKRQQKPRITKPSDASLSPLGSQLFFPFLKQHSLRVVLLSTSLPSL